ncbi:uncharacterized protein QC763_201870 [Podospora pseudopauciseta]|uniref:Polyamine transport protein n=1 Tax=Podospora pseudopauciseta TaxID=2093780 RepID=A0ABR0HMI6_9PEZI|nr:hypothetical protein QC763_201870 [Podospora pseudopauciseta]
MNANHPPELRTGLQMSTTGPDVPPSPESCCFTTAPVGLPDFGEGVSTVPSSSKAYQDALQNLSASHPPWLDKAAPLSYFTPGLVGSREGSPRSFLSHPPVQKPLPVVPETRRKPDPEAGHSGGGIQGRICIDPRMHPTKAHAKLHHPGLLKGADFCDAGVECAPIEPIESPEKDKRLFPFGDFFDDSSDEEGPVVGYRFRRLTGGDICRERVDVSNHKHSGHSSALKVRPALGVTAFNLSDHEQRQPYHGVSKVRTLADIPPIKLLNPPLEIPLRDSSLADPGQVYDDLAPEQTEARSDPSRPSSEYSSPSSSRQLGDMLLYGEGPPSHQRADSAQSMISDGTVFSPFESGQPAVGEIFHQDRSPILDETAVLSDAEPANAPEETLWANGRSFSQNEGPILRPLECGFPTVHPCSCVVPKVQPSTEDLLGVGLRPLVECPRTKSSAERRARTRRAETAPEDSDVELSTASKKASSVDPRRATTTTVSSNSGNGPRSAGITTPRNLDLSRLASFFRDLTKPYETYQSKLTELPARENTVESVEGNQPTSPVSGRIRNLTENSTASTSLDTRFKRTVCNMEQLLNKAMDLANQAVDQDDHQCLDMLGTVDHEADSHNSPPSVHESLPSVYESSDDEQPPPPPPPPPVHKRSIEKVATPRSSIKQPPHVPKHHRSAPGMRSRNVRIEIPKRVTSLRKLNAGMVHVPLSDLQRSRFQELSPPVSPLTHAPSRPDDHGQTDSLSEQGCILMSRGSKKVKKCRSCRRLPLLNHRFSFLCAKEEDVPLKDTRSRPDAKLRPAGKSISGKIRKSNSWSFDGAADHRPDNSMEDSLLHETDGAGPSAERSYPAKDDHFEQDDPHPENGTDSRRINLRGKAHVSLRGYQGFSLARAYRRHPIARDWSTVRKRFVATVACLSTAVIGVLIGIYAGMVPSIQYMIADLQHYAILGNVFFYIGLAIPSFFFWPLPLLHGRKPYILSSLVLAMPLLFPQAITVSQPRSPYVSTWRWALLSSRAFMGLTLGFASMNFHSVLTDLFGASLMSGNPHQEIVDKHDVRRHGGGMGAWLGLWTWCYTGSLGIGFLLGAVIIDSANPSWGFYVSIILIMFILLLNVVCPEVRRSPFRRSVAEVRNGNRVSRRVARGEVMMHRVKDGPTWWGQEVYHGILLSLEMLRQPGFLIIALYTGWIYAQVVLIIVLLGALTSRSYQLRSPFVGLCVAFISFGALVAIPFQKANLFSRGRHHQQQSNEDTFDKKFSWTSHLLRRTIVCLVLPLVGVAYTFASTGPPVPLEIPTLFATMIGLLSGLAISECNGLIMETFDTSDLHPGMTGRPRGASNKSSKRTNYSSFPRVTAGFAVCHTIGFVLAAVATAVGGNLQRNLGQQAATGVVAGILLILTLLLLAVLIRFKDVQIIPVSKNLEMEKWEKYRRESIRRRSEVSAPATQNTMTDAEMWRPLLMGNPSSRMRRVNILELGSMSRWTEIRKKNRLIDETSAHLNRAALESAATALEETTTDLVRRVSSRRNNRSPPPRRFFTGSPGPSGVTRSESPIQRAGMTPKAMELDSFIVVRQPPVAATAVPASPSPLPSHSKTRGAGDDFMERECVMGQTVKEEENENGDRALFESSDFLSSSDDQKDVVGRGRAEIKGKFDDVGHQGHGHQSHFQEEESEGRRNGNEIQRK